MTTCHCCSPAPTLLAKLDAFPNQCVISGGVIADTKLVTPVQEEIEIEQKCGEVALQLARTEIRYGKKQFSEEKTIAKLQNNIFNVTY